MEKIKISNEINAFHFTDFDQNNFKDVEIECQHYNLETMFVNNRAIESLKLYAINADNRSALVTYLSGVKHFELIRFCSGENAENEVILLTWLEELQNIQVNMNYLNLCILYK